MAEESGINKVVDPMAGSYYVESLTSEIIKKANGLIKEVEDAGGMVKAIEMGLPKMRIEESSAKRQARVDSMEETIVGVNKYKPTEKQDINVLSIDNEKVRIKQVERLKKLKNSRDSNEINNMLEKITLASKSKDLNLLEVCVEAAKKRCTVGEMIMLWRKFWKTHFIIKNNYWCLRKIYKAY